jgi:Co/Zn/Cd efflux system component
LVELLLVVLTGSAGLLGDAIHSLSDMPASAVVFLGFRLSRRPPTRRIRTGWSTPRTWPESASPPAFAPV